MNNRALGALPVIHKPYALLAVNVIAADDEKEAQRLATSSYQKYLLLLVDRWLNYVRQLMIWAAFGISMKEGRW